ncbi:DUF2304 domain-containing protein [Lachnoanaerobaculum umeaense]|uniref:DUF2304 domain-containing protein n=1 Tax=Lachnoanaerobaculum umeaense TaxID=617123 RepID=A0A385PXL1_9FIRM|nr:DUF2304 domain-containing protein [Lachnoanaerobaculum umeaense]AYA98712.1 DUF2304 domain-containing protein [Lachnoanaerobaculum umeaense]PZW99952.1 hypothetical protein C7439_10149 [Lachnoanaerobaculum umeaense]
MTIILRIGLILISIISFIVIIRKIRKSKIRIEDGLFWVSFSIILIVFAIFPRIIYFISDLLGAKSPANIVYLIIIGMLLVKLFFMSIQMSLLENKMVNLAQEMSLKEKEDRDRIEYYYSK